MSRRLMKALEDRSIQYDNTVRNASSCIVQFVYGYDGMDPSQMEEKSGHPLNFDRLLMKVKVVYSHLEISYTWCHESKTRSSYTRLFPLTGHLSCR